LLQKLGGEYKEAEGGNEWSLYSSRSSFYFFTKGRKSVDVDINRAKELMMKKHLLMHNSSL
jgi:hypothetical protein